MTASSSLAQVRRLHLLGVFAPVMLFAVAGSWFATHVSAGQGLYLGVGVATLLLLGAGAVVLRAARDDLSHWGRLLPAPAVLGAGIAAMTPASLDYEWTIPRYLGVGVVLLLLLLAGWLPARRARRLVLANLTSAEVVNSRITVPFPATGMSGYLLLVGPDSLRLRDLHGNRVVFGREVSLDDVTSVEYETVAAETVHPVPGEDEQTRTVPAGPAVRIGVPGGEWLFPVGDPATVTRLVQRRIAAGRRTTDHRGHSPSEVAD
jgi:hypothetical protein